MFVKKCLLFLENIENILNFVNNLMCYFLTVNMLHYFLHELFILNLEVTEIELSF